MSRALDSAHLQRALRELQGIERQLDAAARHAATLRLAKPAFDAQELINLTDEMISEAAKLDERAHALEEEARRVSSAPGRRGSVGRAEASTSGLVAQARSIAERIARRTEETGRVIGELADDSQRRLDDPTRTASACDPSATANLVELLRLGNGLLSRLLAA